MSVTNVSFTLNGNFAIRIGKKIEFTYRYANVLIKSVIELRGETFLCQLFLYKDNLIVNPFLLDKDEMLEMYEACKMDLDNHYFEMKNTGKLSIAKIFYS